MTHRDDLLRRVKAANPLPKETDLPEEVVDGRPPLAILIKEENYRPTDAHLGVRPRGRRNSRRTKPATVFATVFVLILAAIGVVAILTNDQTEFVGDPEPTTTVSTDATITSMAGSPTPPVGAWNPILATTRAKTAPPAATCPPGSNPNNPGPVDQERPAAGPWNNQAAAFDRGTGRILFVDNAAQTWTFDVCTNTWQNMNPELVRKSGELVYDVDSDLIVSFGRGRTLAVYDAETNIWTQRELPTEYGDSLGDLGAVYDPLSGLVIAQTEERLVAYDVDSDRWTSIGPIVDGGYPPFLIGYAAEIDRLIFLDFNAALDKGRGRLVDPRTGEYTDLDYPPASVAGGFGSFSYATGGGTAFTFGHTAGGGVVCKLDPVALDWACTDNLGTDQTPSAMVFDSINGRLVMVNDFCCNWPGRESTDDVWGWDSNTGIWAALLDPTPSGSEIVFDLETDDLCGWFTAEDMNRIVAVAQQRAGTDFEFVRFEPTDSSSERPGCWSDPPYRYSAWGTPGWEESRAAEMSIVIAVQGSPFPDEANEWYNTEEHPERFVAHDMLDEDVTYNLIRYHVAYDAGLAVYLRVEGRDGILQFGFGVGDESANGTPKYEEVGLAIASELLHRMNWVQSG